MTTLQFQQNKKILLGAIHLPSFQNDTSRPSMKDIESFALHNAKIFAEGGFDGVFIQDQTEGPATLKSVSLLAAVSRFVSSQVDSIHIGSQMECDDAEAILAVAHASGASFVRIKSYVGTMIKDRGLVHGQGHTAISYKKNQGIQTQIFADIFDRCGAPLGDLSLQQAAKLAVQTGADALIITGKNHDETVEMLKAIRKAFPKVKTICGGGVNMTNIKELLSICDGAIVSSSLKDDADPLLWSVTKIKDLVAHVQRH